MRNLHNDLHHRLCDCMRVMGHCAIVGIIPPSSYGKGSSHLPHMARDHPTFLIWQVSDLKLDQESLHARLAAAKKRYFAMQQKVKLVIMIILVIMKKRYFAMQQ